MFVGQLSIIQMSVDQQPNVCQSNDMAKCLLAKCQSAKRFSTKRRGASLGTWPRCTRPEAVVVLLIAPHLRLGGIPVQIGNQSKVSSALGQCYKTFYRRNLPSPCVIKLNYIGNLCGKPVNYNCKKCYDIGPWWQT
jgi:hypothetical protein